MLGDHHAHNENKLQDAYNRGRHAFRDGWKRNSNPYEETDEMNPLREEWFHGWDHEKQLQESTRKKPKTK